MIFYPDNLPVISHKDEITESLRSRQVTIIAGDTGSGKTTQIPKFCLEALPDSSKIIGCTQPRRVAAVSVSERVAEELKPANNIVGYKIRFHDRTGPDTRIKFMTDGVLLAETQQDPLFQKYGVIILDEAHERSLNIDFLLGYFRRILTKRPDLKLIITSATIDTESFAAHYPGSHVINIAGRSYPVEVQYSPIEEDNVFEKEGYIEHCVEAINNIFMQEPPGDILAFLPTERDIRICCDLLHNRHLDAEILPMFGRLLPADQRKIFRHYKKTKIVVATNVAETSITVPGIRYVVDTGLARISSYNVRAKTTSLPISKISRASCDQRKGRCGRVAPGVCVRLFSEEDYLNRSDYTLPEIRRSNLADVILRMISLKLGDPQSFPFVDSPHSNIIRDGYKQLFELGAVTSNQKLTHNGKLMARMPIDPCISRIIIESTKNHCLKEIRIIASALAIQDPRVRPANREKEADAAHALFSHPHSDFLVLLNIWKHFHAVRGEVKSWSRLKKFCKGHYLSFQRMREWLDLHEQMTRILKRLDTFQDNEKEASYEAIHKSLASGFLRNIARKKEKKIYQTTSGKEIMIFPGSHQFAKSGQWIIAASFLETNRLYALTVATIEPEWLETIGGRLCKYSWDNPRWMKKSGQVIADERVSLFGLILVNGRQVNFAKRDVRNQKEAKGIFIQQALIDGKLIGSYPFLQHNLALVKKWEETEQRLRKRDILVDNLTLFTFYDERLSDVVYDRASLNRFLKKKKEKEFLFLQEEDILIRQVYGNEYLDFPTTRSIGSHAFTLEYSFVPGKENDGVTMRIPVNLAETVSPEICEWVVPGLLKEKTTFLLKGLPKKIRKHLIPISATVDLLLDDIDLFKGSFYHALERSIFKHFKMNIRRSDWVDHLPNHLRMRFSLYNDSDKIITSGYDLQEVCRTLRTNPEKAVMQKSSPSPEHQKIVQRLQGKIVKTWDFAMLPDKLPLITPQGEIAGFSYTVLHPVPEKGGVKIGFENMEIQARQINKRGIACLYRLQFSDQYKALKKYCKTTLSGPSSLWLTGCFPSKREASEALIFFVLHSIFPTGSGQIHDKKTYQDNIERVKKEGFYNLGMQICENVMAVLRRRQEVQKQIAHFAALCKKTNSFSSTRYAEYKNLLDEILPNDFLKDGTVKDLEDCDRYLRSLFIRIERAYADYSKEDKKSVQVQPHIHNLQTMEKKRNELSEDCIEHLTVYKTMIQEFRLSLFSPEIKTKLPVSAKKLQQLWQQITLSH